MKKFLLPAIGLLILAAFAASFFFFRQSLTDNRPLTTDNRLPSVPEVGGEITEEGLAIPKASQDITPGSLSKIRTFELVAAKDAFSLKKIIVYQNDVVRIKFTSLDKTYDLTFPDLSLSQKTTRGEVVTLEFQALKQGSFSFSCSTCAKKNEKIQGVLIVVPRL